LQGYQYTSANQNQKLDWQSHKTSCALILFLLLHRTVHMWGYQYTSISPYLTITNIEDTRNLHLIIHNYL